MISAVVLTRNSALTLERCLASLTWVGEILVIDAESTDTTLEICQRPAAPWAGKIRVVRRPWPGFRVQRNFALKEARFDWIFSVDSDESCSPELAARLQAILRAAPDPAAPRAYQVRRQEYFLGRPIYFGIWNPSYQDRFFQRAGVEYVNDIHEYPRFNEKPTLIHEPLHHWPDFGVELFLTKMNHYTTIEAQDRFDRGVRTNLFRLLGAFPAMFFKNYFYYQAYRDGGAGLVISLLEGVSRVIRHVKLWQLEHRFNRAPGGDLPVRPA